MIKTPLSVRIPFWFVVAIVTILAIIFVFPIYWLFLGSFKTIMESVKIPPDFLPHTITLTNYVSLFKAWPVTRWILNSLLVSGLSVIAVIFVSLMAGYAFAKKEFPGKQIIFWVFMSTMMFPAFMSLIPMFMIVKNLGLYNSIAGVFLPGVITGGSFFFARQFLSTLPSELLDAAKIDGASEFRIFFHIVMPLAKPLIAVLSIFTFIGTWGDYLWPLIITRSMTNRTLAVGVVIANCVPATLPDNVGMAMAGACMVALPMIIFFFAFQKYFTGGLTLGAVKG